MRGLWSLKQRAGRSSLSRLSALVARRVLCVLSACCGLGRVGLRSQLPCQIIFDHLRKELFEAIAQLLAGAAKLGQERIAPLLQQLMGHAIMRLWAMRDHRIDRRFVCSHSFLSR